MTRETAKTEVPISSLIDVVFLLIMFFIVTAVIDTDSDVPVDLVKSQNIPPVTVVPHKVQVTVKDDGSVFLHNFPLADLSVLGRQMKAVIKERGDAVTAVIRADKNTLHQNISDVIETLKSSGVKRISLTSEPI